MTSRVLPARPVSALKQLLAASTLGELRNEKTFALASTIEVQVMSLECQVCDELEFLRRLIDCAAFDKASGS